MWGTEVEIERKRRIDVAAWAYAYEVENDSLVTDAVFDSECLKVNVTLSTGNKKLDTFFRKHFQPDTGLWVHKHPDKEGLRRVIAYKRGLTKDMAKQFKPGEQKQLAKRIGEDLNNYTAKLYDDGHRKHLGASMIGDNCSRKLWYGFRWCLTPDYVNTKGENHKGRMMRLFNRGHKEEIRFVDWLRGMGFLIQEFANTETKEQLRMKDCNGHFGGSLDGKVFLPPEYDMPDEMLLEFKTSGEKAYDKLAKDGVKLAKPVHFAQMCTYGKRYELKHALYMCVNKNTDEIYIEIVELDWNFADVLTNKAANIINSPTPPPKLSESSAYFECKFCDFAAICHGQTAYEKTCRSCVNVVPVDNGEWHCRIYQQNIPDEFVKKGCDAYQEAR